jgi:peptidoglycan/xylan/chitin deacetylase (PgdA/CDA1 family)
MRLAALALLPFALLSLYGCARKHARKPGPSQAVEKPFPKYTRGEALILESHDIGLAAKRWVRTPQRFREDLDRLYRLGYRPVTLAQYVSGRFRLPKGRSPVVLTFDDARRGQFFYLPDGSLSSECGIGILEAFHAKHPEFAATATFFILPRRLFDQPRFRAAKLKWLVDHGYEIGCHTLTHRPLGKLSDTGVRKEIALGCRGLHDIDPRVTVTSLALPSGVAPKNRDWLRRGFYDGFSYELQAVVLAGAGPAQAPQSPKMDPYRIPRVQAIDGPYGIDFWLNFLKKHPERRLVAE